ncbi:hypothetical protein V5799_019604 [Amblyomma americanum]|uniref:Uncharacterized protein n=1 Tax=Amblyomma americanum TaxID=6943 RepID=A0AAQ4EWI6_AMBAM
MHAQPDAGGENSATPTPCDDHGIDGRRPERRDGVVCSAVHSLSPPTQVVTSFCRRLRSADVLTQPATDPNELQ